MTQLDVIARHRPSLKPMSTPWELWAFRVAWLILPFTAGPFLTRALDDGPSSLQTGATIALWLVWAAMLIASMVPRTETLTATRIVAPAAVVAVLAATLSELDDGAVDLVLVAALVSTAVAALLAFRPQVSDAFVDGSSYGEERRFLLRTPAAILSGPIQLVWAVIAFGVSVGPVLLLAQQWIVGGIALVVGWPLAYLAVPVLHRLSNRWLVFVPAGMVVHDKTALREPQLFRKESITALGPAPADTDLEDLSLGGLGLALRAELAEPSKIIRNERGTDVELTDIEGFVVSPNLPGKVVTEAKTRGFAIG